MTNSNSAARRNGVHKPAYDANFFDSMPIGGSVSSSDTLVGSETAAASEDGLSGEERRVLERLGEDLARLGRVKRVGLGVREKIEFVKVWKKKR